MFYVLYVHIYIQVLYHDYSATRSHRQIVHEGRSSHYNNHITRPHWSILPQDEQLPTNSPSDPVYLSTYFVVEYSEYSRVHYSVHY